MSFDLNFCRQDNSVPSLGELTRYFQNLPFFTINELQSEGMEFVYHNEATSVYCVFSAEPDGDHEPELGQCAASGLAFNLNFVRPSFFAYETMPMVEAFCTYFRLDCEDPQEERIGPATAKTLIESWCKHNSWAVNAIAKEPEVAVGLKYLAEPKATSWWSYMYAKQRLEDNLTEDLFVPSVILLETPEKELARMIVWPDGISQLFPDCDYVLVERTTRKLLGKTTEKGLVTFAELLTLIEPYLEDYKTESSSVRYLPNSKRLEVHSLLPKLKLRPVSLPSYTRVAGDSFHDVELPIG